MSVYENVHQCVLCELSPLTVYSIFKLCICFAHELMCMWFGHSSFFHLMNISILGISDAVNGCFRDHTSSDLFNFWCIPVLLIIFIPRHLKSVGHYGIPSVKKFALSVRPSVRLSIRHHFVSALYLEYFSTDLILTLYKS